ncbi:MAG: hypothetical protein ABI614_12130 [Planctomycetota bacterium]
MATWQSQFDAAAKQREEWLKGARKPFVELVRAAKISKLSATDDEKKLLLEKPDDGEAKKLANRFKKELKIEDADYVAALPKDQKAKWDELDQETIGCFGVAVRSDLSRRCCEIRCCPSPVR